MEQMQIYAEMQEQAVHGNKAIPRNELTSERKEEKDRQLAEMNGLNYDEVKSNTVFG